MCDRESFAKIRDAIADLQKADAVQSEQIKTLFATTAELKATVQGEIADLEAKIVMYEEYQTKYPLLKAVFATFIADAQNRIKVLQALGGGTAE